MRSSHDPAESITSWWRRRSHVRPAERLTEGNRQLTSLTGALLIPLMGLVFLTGLAVDMYWHAHYMIGFVLIPVVSFKVVTTGYRAVSYYLGRVPYRSAGPPELSLRILAPVVIISTVAALATGVALWAQHSRSGTLSTLHTDAAVVCAGTMGIHVLAYLPRAMTESATAVRQLSSRLTRIRLAIVGVVLLGGILLATLTFANGTWPAREPRQFGDGPRVEGP